MDAREFSKQLGKVGKQATAARRAVRQQKAERAARESAVIASVEARYVSFWRPLMDEAEAK